ncbi:MAG: preprotein translocase subunit YajC [Rhodospirillaceae bacterium]|jgi:preprotein translocase subunit YajC|nr:preprotein translocase subunit YajC [Rhodospirillaceae bacterium]MBT5243305.1 preprotein translocase subunit YajC [Rhodospirillaceae bacterium]MBT5563911.1 preprotein translocase subunit YajC [Rhodospirillaceae bacterium]MBT6240885.1 preprotein translocase subunit YajC [Rhodospirillaceae bacterium]MBT7137352.1 preprotein translocase subunit YajC [Rhodospirillaceae bacterium]
MSFISPAYAQAAGGAGGASGLEAMFPLILIFVVFYFLLIRPQQKKAKEHKAMLEAVRRGDKVVTGGGILGTVTKVSDDQEITVEIADGVKVRVQRGLLASVLSKTEPVKEDKKDKKSKKDDKSDGDGDGEKKGPASKLKGLLGGKN